MTPPDHPSLRARAIAEPPPRPPELATPRHFGPDRRRWWPAPLLDRARLLRLLALLPLALSLLTVLAPPLNHDVAAVLNFAERWLAGERLYADLIDVNPPLVFVLNLPAAAIGAWTPLDAVQGLLLCLLALCVLVWWLAARLRPAALTHPVEAGCLAIAVPLLTLGAGYDFGQREHVMAVAAIPYLMLRARRIEGEPTGRWMTIGIALLAGVGFALKPHFLAVPALVEGLVLLRRGPLRALRDPVPWLMALVWLLYLGSIPLLFPEYFGQVLPLVWDYYLDLGEYSWWQVLVTERLGSAELLLIPLTVLAFLPRGRALPQTLALGALGGLVSAVVQHKGWTYHAVPVRTLAALLAVVLAARWLEVVLPAARARLALPGIAATTAFALLVLNFAGAEAPWRELTFSWSRPGRIAAMLKREAYNERVLVLAPDIYGVYPAINYARGQSTLRTMNLWLLQGVYERCPGNGARYRETWEMSRAEFFVYRTVAEDFARTPPAAVLVSRNPGIPWCEREFDILEYFSRHPLFAETFSRYRLTTELEGYRLFVREN